MAADEFFARWAKKNAESAKASESAPDKDASELVPDSASPLDTQPELRPVPTMDDVAGLTHDSDYSGFMAQGVDESVKRSAMKKLFTDPHFNIMDGLDVYIEDFNKFEPMTPAFIAGLSHAKGLMDPLSQLKSPLMKLLDIPQDVAKGEVEIPAVAAIETEAIERGDAAIAAGEELIKDMQSGGATDSNKTEANTSVNANANANANTNKEPNVSSHVDEE